MENDLAPHQSADRPSEVASTRRSATYRRNEPSHRREGDYRSSRPGAYAISGGSRISTLWQLREQQERIRELESRAAHQRSQDAPEQPVVLATALVDSPLTTTSPVHSHVDIENPEDDESCPTQVSVPSTLFCGKIRRRTVCAAALLLILLAIACGVGVAVSFSSKNSDDATAAIQQVDATHPGNFPSVAPVPTPTDRTVVDGTSRPTSLRTLPPSRPKVESPPERTPAPSTMLNAPHKRRPTFPPLIKTRPTRTLTAQLYADPSTTPQPVLMTKSTGHWIQLGQALEGDLPNDEFGNAVALSANGKIVACGGRYYTNGSLAGIVKAFYWNGTSWVPLGSVLTGDNVGDQLGASVALSSNGATLAAGAPWRRAIGTESGEVRVWRFADGDWQVLGHYIPGSRRTSRLGESVAISADGETVAAGAIHNSDNGIFAGLVQVFRYNGSSDTWNQLGQDLPGESEQDQFGISVALSEDGLTVAAGSVFNSANGRWAGQVRIFKYNANTRRWRQQGQSLLGEAEDDRFGGAVALSADGTIVAAGAFANDGNEAASGQARVWKYNNGRWNQLGPSIYGQRFGDQFGRAVALSADGLRLAAGSNERDATGPFSGMVAVYEYRSGAWHQVGENVNGEAGGDFFGSSVAMSSDGSVFASGAIRNNGNGYNSGHARVFTE